MGKINYTLLNASVMNVSRLNMTGEAGKLGGGAGGYWPDGTPAAIRRSAVLWYDIAKQGATNETMAANPVLKDLSGHGHDATCYNFGWTEESGISTASYPGALVSDGVDDYAYVDGLPLLDDFTFITKRTINAQKKNSVGAIKGESDSENINNAFGLDVINTEGDYYYTSFGSSNLDPGDGVLKSAEIVVGTPSTINGLAVNRGSIADNFPYLWLMGYLPSAGFAEEQLYTFLLFDRTLTDEEIEWVKNNLIENNYTVDELDASLVEAWVFSGLRNEDAPATVTGERWRELSLRNFGYTAGSGFDGGCLVTDGVDDYGICADFPIKDTYTLIMKFATLNGKLFSAACTTTYFDASDTRLNGIFPIYITATLPYASMMGRKKNVSASSELAAVWMNKEAFCGEAYDDTSGQYTPPDGQEATVYVGRLDDRGIYGSYKLAYLAFYDKVMTAEEAEAEVEKLEELWAQRSGGG